MAKKKRKRKALEKQEFFKTENGGLVERGAIGHKSVVFADNGEIVEMDELGYPIFHEDLLEMSEDGFKITTKKRKALEKKEFFKTESGGWIERGAIGHKSVVFEDNGEIIEMDELGYPIFYEDGSQPWQEVEKVVSAPKETIPTTSFE